MNIQYRPCNTTPCDTCGQTPTVQIYEDGELVHETHYCGTCTFGTAEALNPAKWN